VAIRFRAVSLWVFDVIERLVRDEPDGCAGVLECAAMRYRLTLRSAAAIAAAAMLAVAIGESAGAQTLVNPNPPAARAQPPPAPKPRTSERAKPCGAYGAGFVNIPGTGACVKIGGSVSVDSSVNRSR
jgi:hypothetical protein